MRRLIINADDCNLTPGVTRGILKAHDLGVVTSTTVLINLPLEEKTVRELKKRRGLGVGVHLNITLGAPVSPLAKVRSLLKGGKFRRPLDYLAKSPFAKEVAHEYEAQVRLFEKRFGKKPDHLDTHHHLHDFPIFFFALAEVARGWKLPIRRSRIFQWSESRRETRGLKTTDYLFGSLSAAFIWEARPFHGVVETLPEGTSEIACHPGYCDGKLRQISSLQEARVNELNLLSDLRLRKIISALEIELIRFSEI